MAVDLEFLTKVEMLAARLDALDYFQVLGIEQTADPQAVRSAYHKLARRFHPDRFHHLNLPRFTADLTAIAKRIAEAYITLRDDAKRAHYTQAINSPDRESRLRYSEADEKSLKDERETGSATTPQGKQFFTAARAAFQSGDRAEAIKSLKMALMYEAENDYFKQVLEEWSGEGAEE